MTSGPGARGVATSSRRFLVFRTPEGVQSALGSTVVALGKFDGVHRGHQALIERALAAGRALELPTGVALFERHPYTYLRGRASVPPVLTGLADRLRLIRAAGADFAVLVPADPIVLDVPAEDFVRDVLCRRMRVQLLAVGEDFRFGKGGTGDVQTLRGMVATGELGGLETVTARSTGAAISSTRIRQELARGDVRRAGELLGRPYDVTGRLGVRTIQVPRTRALPAAGRYHVEWRPLHDRSARDITTGLVTVPSAGGDTHRLEITRSNAPHLSRGPTVRVVFQDRAG
jgi:FAD synthase